MTPTAPRAALNKGYRRVRPLRAEIDAFRRNLIDLLDHGRSREGEEFHKKLISDFLARTYYHPAHFMNIKGNADLVIHEGKDSSSDVAVIVEVKSPANTSEMVTLDNLNTKAFHELLLYYLRERFDDNPNINLKHLIITNGITWFIFDAHVFEKLFAQNKKLEKAYVDFSAKRLSGPKTDFFYTQIASPVLASLSGEIPFTFFDLRSFETIVRNESPETVAKLIPLLKILSPVHLLKLPFSNDSNTLNRDFYTELLHIVGLEETSNGSKRLIGRKERARRDSESLIEATMIQLDALDKIDRLQDPHRFGDTRESRLFSVALELVIAWVNRILFLKLLEAQLISYHGGSPAYAFMKPEMVRDFDGANALFFQILARRPAERDASISARFPHVPYLNSSLFQPTQLEHECIFLSNLPDDLAIPILKKTVLRDGAGRRRTGTLNTLTYLLDFLDAYDFSSDGTAEILEAGRPLITASVLGLIFEKINGYREGSFFTPGIITMHVCREVVREAIIRRFNDVKGWSCNSTQELYDRIEDRNEANEIFNGVRLCDPAVGSGHYLVSALNELLALKSELRILQDREGARLKEYRIEVINDEISISDDDGDPFRYTPALPESQRVQEAIFHEKQRLIEGSLFGVDINANSARICQLRLWIELLKHAYYRSDGELETLPNIDINIKTGDSLVSRFGLDTDLASVLRRRGMTVADYQAAVRAYQNAASRDEKRTSLAFIEDIKNEFRSAVFDNDPKVRRHRAATAELDGLRGQHLLLD